jgi:amiloride-sensitive sodium channel
VADSYYSHQAAHKEEKDSTCTTPSCLAMTISQISKIETNLEDATAVVIIDIFSKPTLRYIRRVTITKLDIIVQIGGIIGLFIGASILSLIEIFFLLADILRKRNLIN